MNKYGIFSLILFAFLVLFAFFWLPIKLFLNGWRKTEMPFWVRKAYYRLRKKVVPYGKTYFFKGNTFTYRVYTTHPKVQGNSGEIFCYRKLND